MARFFKSPYAPMLFMALVIVLLPLLPLSNFHLRMATLLFIFSVVVLGMNLLMGYAGQISLGHAAFFGLGAYAVIVGNAHYGVSPWVGLCVSLFVSGGVAWVIGKPILRLKGYHLAMATLAFGSIFSMFLNNELQITGGPDGMSMHASSVRILGLNARMSAYWIYGGVLLLVMWLIANLLNSPTGREMRSIHDSETAAGVLGIDVASTKLKAFVISAVLATLAGACFAIFDKYITPESGSILRSIEFVTMAVVGGLGSILGSVVGTAILIVLPQFLTIFHEYEHAILGGILIVILIFLPRGIVPSLARLFAWRSK